jgi:glucose 1-dehydrogenase
VSAIPFRRHPPEARLLAGRRALVTGATSGIGRAVALELAAHGADVAVNHHHHPEEAEPVVAAIRSDGGNAIPVAMDVSREEDVARAFAEVREALGVVDLLVNNAGVQAPHPLVDLPLDEWERVIGVNLTGTFLCSREAARHLLAEGRSGVIVAVTSVHDRMPWELYSHYAASKAGQRLFLESIAKELAPHGVRAVAVAPGAIATPINEDVMGDPEARSEVEDQIPMGRVGRTHEVARAIAWLASDAASYVTGATLLVDGGLTLYPPGAG